MEAKENDALQLAPWIEEHNQRFKIENAKRRMIEQREFKKQRLINHLTFGAWCALATAMLIFGSLYIKGGF